MPNLPEPAARRVILRDPLLPAFLETIVLRNLEVGGVMIDFQLRRREGGSLSLQVLRNDHQIEVSIV